APYPRPRGAGIGGKTVLDDATRIEAILVGALAAAILGEPLAELDQLVPGDRCLGIEGLDARLFEKIEVVEERKRATVIGKPVGRPLELGGIPGDLEVVLAVEAIIARDEIVERLERPGTNRGGDRAVALEQAVGHVAAGLLEQELGVP